MIKKIAEWIKESMKKDIEVYCCAVHKTFGLVKMEDGRMAEVQITLELDEDDWKDN